MAIVHVSHILVAQKYQAEDLERRLQEGADFEELARKHSSCPSSARGGDLGAVDDRRLVDDFREALEPLAVGQISGPVRTRFGYHLIRRNPAPVVGQSET
ncbi:MAG: peptidylprolyl isomerase [Bdellovibrionaceae bacterium]|nr:peptidylprolyl isomerase [Pseudobdellovibrionaceae bacterium]